MGSVLDCFARETGAFVLVPADSPDVVQNLGAGFTHLVSRVRLRDTICAILAFYEVTFKPGRGRGIYIASGRWSRRPRQVIAYGGPQPLRLTLSRGTLRTFGPPFWNQFEPASRVKLRVTLMGMAMRRMETICSETVRAFLRPRLADGCLRVDDRVWLRYPCGVRPDLRPGRFVVRVLGLGPPRVVELRYSPATLGRLRWLRRGALSASSERMLRQLARRSRRGSETARRARRLLNVYGAKPR